MKRIRKTLLSLSLALCLLVIPFGGVGVFAETAAPLNLMPTADDGYTIVEGDGTVAIEDGVLTIVNNGDGDFRVTIDNTAQFDMSVLNTLHMQFSAEMPFKFAQHIISAADSSSDWVNTSTNYMDIFEIDYVADRAVAGEYDVKMNLNDHTEAITDKSSVYFEQFIILLTGKGTFTLNVAEMMAVEIDEPATDATTTTAVSTDDATTTTAEPADDTTTTTKTAASEEDQAGSNIWLPIIIVIIVVIVCVVVILIIRRRKA